MSLPAQLQKQSKEIQELYEKMGKEPEGEPNQNVDAPDKPIESESKQSPEKPAKPAEPQNDQTLAQKYKTLQGMYNAEVPKLHATNRDLQNRVVQLEQLLSSMQTQTKPPVESKQTQTFITDKDKEEYGESIDMMERVAKQVIAPLQEENERLKAALSQLQPLGDQVNQLAQTQHVTAEQHFWQDLSMLVPDWQTINNNPEFQEWLLIVDPLTGYTRQNYLENAQRNLDARRVTAFFEEWANRTGSGNEHSPKPQPSVAPDKRAAELAKQVAPGKGRTTTATSTPSAKIYTAADVKQFYHDVSQGKYVGRKAEKERLEADIFAAQSEGRLIG